MGHQSEESKIYERLRNDQCSDMDVQHIIDHGDRSTRKLLDQKVNEEMKLRRDVQERSGGLFDSRDRHGNMYKDLDVSPTLFGLPE